MKSILSLFAICISTIIFAQSDTLKVGEKVILTGWFSIKVDDYWTKNWKDTSRHPGTIWTITKEDNIDIFLTNKFQDSFWYSKKYVSNDIYDYKIIRYSFYQQLVKKYTLRVVSKLLNGRTWIGMNDQQLLISRGHPKTINRTRTGSGSTEQWIYEGYTTQYFYLKNGLLTVIQD